MNKVLVGYFFCRTRRACCYGMKDIKGCFDCIEHIAAILILMHFEIAYIVATTPFYILQKAMHKLRTGYGVFEPFFGNERLLPDIGQENGPRPALWC